MTPVPPDPAPLLDLDRRVLAACLDGLPLTEAPYAALARTIDVEEGDVLDSLRRLEAAGVVGRFGLVVRHHELGFGANAMCVFDVPDEQVVAAGTRLAALPFVTLCARRQRRPPAWPYNLYCMIHGTDRRRVEAQYVAARAAAGLDGVPGAILFGRRRFKQCAGRYVAAGTEAHRRAG